MITLKSQILSKRVRACVHRLLPIYTRMHGEWLGYAKSTSQNELVFSLKVRDDWVSQLNPLILSST